MRSKNLIAMASITLLAVGYAFYDFESSKHAAEDKAEKAKVFKFVSDQVSHVEISTKDKAEAIKIGRTPEGWKLEEPLQETADQEAAQEFLEGLVAETAEEVASEGAEPVDWKVYGLDEPRGQIVLQNNLGERKTIFISAKKNYQGDAFLRRDRDNQVLLGSGTWFAKLEKTPLDFRDKRLLRKPLAQISEISVRNAQEVFELKLDEGQWKNPRQEQWALDQNKVRDFLAVLGQPVATEFVKDENPGPEDIEKWGLTRPRAKVVLKFKDGTSWDGTLGRNKDAQNFVWVGAPAMVVKVNAAEAEKWAAIQQDTFRDRKSAFDFKKADVKKIEIKTPKGAASLEVQPDAPEAAGFLVKLAGLEIATFLDQKTVWSTPPVSTVVLRNEQGAALFELRLGASQKKKINGQDRAVILASSSLYPDLFTLDEAMVKALGLDELTGKKP